MRGIERRLSFTQETKMKTLRIPTGFQPVRRDELRQEREHDTYKRQEKPPEPAVCPDCGAIFHAGRWQWGMRREGSTELICPACHRIRDRFPAGFLHVSGSFFGKQRDELLSLIRHHAEKARAEHPMARIMGIKDNSDDPDDGIVITTTDIHLARDLGEALHHAYHGELEFHYNKEEKLLRVHWSR